MADDKATPKKAPARKLGLPNMKFLQARMAQEKIRRAAKAARK